MASSSKRTSSADEERSTQWKQLREEMHRAIDLRNHEEVLRCLQAAPCLKLWLHPVTEESAMHKALTKRYYGILSLLQDHECTFEGIVTKTPCYTPDKDGAQGQQTSATEDQVHQGTNNAVDTITTSHVTLSMEEETSVQWEDVRRQMHQAIGDRNYVQVQRCLETVTNLKLWLHPRTEESALYRAVENNAFHIYAILHANNCQFKEYKERECIDEGNLNEVQRSELRRQQEFVRRPKDAHLSHIKNAIRVQSDECKEKIANMIDNLDSDELLSVILKVVAVSPDLKVIMDSDEEDIQTLVGCQTGGKLFGLTRFHEEKIFVGGKRRPTTEKASESEVRGTLLHEMCHLAMHLVYNNDGKPYCSPDIERRRCYLDIIEEMEKNSEKLDPIIRLPFEDQEKIEEELVVRVPHIIAKHFGSEEGISILQGQAPKLFLFFKNEVIPDMMKYVGDACPGMDAKKIHEENARLGKAKRVDDLEVIFEKPMMHQDLEDVPLLILTSADLALLEIVVNDAVKSKGHPYLFFEASQWDDTVKAVLRDNKCNVILLTCNEEKDFKEKLDLLGEVSKVVGTRIILLVSEKDRAHFSKEVGNDSYFSKNHIINDVSLASFENITLECKDDVRKKSLVRFQGSEYEIQLADVVDLENFLSCIDTRTFLELCASRYVDVGPTLRKQEKDVSGYCVARTLQGRLKFDARKLHEDSNDDVFFFYGCPEETVKKFIPRNTFLRKHWWRDESHKFGLIGDVEMYEIIRKKDHYRNKTLHLLEYCGTESAVGQTSSKATGSDFPFVERYCNDEYLMNELEEKVVIICGDPGIGKSALADWISVKLNDANNKKWVISINLFEKYVSKHDDKIGTDVESIKQLASLFGVKTDGLEFLLFQQSVQNGAPFEIVMIFDAFDEATEEIRKNTLKLVNLLIGTRVSKIYIMSRSIFKHSIEDSITADAESLELAPLWYSDITEFMKNHWRANGAHHLTDEELQSEAMETARSYEEEFGNNMEVLRNPLLLKMICELEQSSLLDRKSTSDARRCRSLFQVYEKFAEYKHKIYAEEKLRANLNSSSGEQQNANKKRRQGFFDTLGRLALLVIFREQSVKVPFTDKSKDLNPEGSLMKELADNLSGYGFIEGHTEGLPRFIHRSFAEFFAAHFLFNEVKTAGTDNPDLMKFVLDMYGKDEHRQVTYFLDSFASASFPMHSSIINGDYSSLHSIDEKAMEIVDEFGRTLLHVAAVQGKNEHIWNILPINADSLEVKDKFGVTPIMYADKCGILFTLDKFCFLHSDENIEWEKNIPATFENVTKEKDLWESVLLKSVVYRYCSLLNVILSRFCRKRRHCSFDSVNPRAVDVDTIRDLEKITVLFYADSKALCELLLPYCDIRTVDTYGNSLLHNAVRMSYPFEVVEFYFLRLPVDVNSRLRGTPLHVSITEGNPDAVKLLLLRSRTDVTDYYDCNATGKAFEEYNPDIINLVLPNSSIVHREGEPAFFYPISITELWWLLECVVEDGILVSMYHSPKTMRQIRRDADEEYTYQEQFEAMFPYLNIHDESLFMVNFLLRHSLRKQQRLVPLKQLLLRFDASSSDEDGWSALHQCAKWGSVDETKLLLPHSNTSGRDRGGRTALQVATTKHGAEHDLSRILLRWSRKSINIGEGGQSRKKMKWALLDQCMIW